MAESAHPETMIVEVRYFSGRRQHTPAGQRWEAAGDGKPSPYMIALAFAQSLRGAGGTIRYRCPVRGVWSPDGGYTGAEESAKVAIKPRPPEPAQAPPSPAQRPRPEPKPRRRRNRWKPVDREGKQGGLW